MGLGLDRDSGLPLLADTPDDGIWVDSGSVWVFRAVGRDPAYPG